MTSMSPEQYATQSPPEGSNGNGLSLEVLKNLTEKRTTREGNPPKKRGPKPDSKPALTRRQELNRQAQRTHRERKEMYIRALEDEVLRLKEIYSTVAQDREKLAEENRLLKDALVQSGIQIPNLSNGRGSGGEGGASNFGGSGAPDSSFGFSNNFNSSFSPSGASHSTAPTGSPDNSGGRYNALSGEQLKQATKKASESGFDIEQAGIDFVLALEKPCMAHIPLVMDFCTENKGFVRGHALMASCPSAQTKTLDKSLWGQSHTHDKDTEETPAQGTWEINKADLSTLLDLSSSLDLGGEVTPVMAWSMIMNHPDFSKLTRNDFDRITNILGSKVRCFGFGAVMEEFDLQDAIADIHGSRIEQAAY